jgi:hypothetical protein
MSDEERIRPEAGEPSGGYGAGTGVGNPEVDEEKGNPDWDRPIPDEEAQKTAREADPDDLGGTETTMGLTAGGEGTEVGGDADSGGGTPLTEGYVTGGSHRAYLDDAQEMSS